MDINSLTLEDLLPHRNGMLLIDTIINADESTAASRSVVSDQWPLFDGASVCSTVMIELTAQTSGINNGIRRLRERGKKDGTMGWIAGIKSAVFHVETIPVGSSLITRTQNSFCYEDFREVTGTVSMDGNIIGEVILQLVSA